MKIRILIIIKMNRNLLLVFMSMFLISFVSSQGLIVPETLSINYSTIDVNDSQYLRGYSPTTLRTWFEGLFDSVYCKLTGCTMTGDINMGGNDITNTGNITGITFLGDGSHLTGISSAVYNITDGTAQGQMAFWNTASWVNTETSELFWDDVNKRLGIGTDSPQNTLNVMGDINATGTLSYSKCAEGMAYVDKMGGYCIDKYEAVALNSDGTWNESSDDNGWTNTETASLLANGGKAGSISGKYPWVYIKQTEARTACENAGKHLCTDEEWLGAANIKGQIYNLDATISDCTVSTNCVAGNDLGPNGGDACYGGNMTDCVSSEGVYDMVGNVWEWTNETVGYTKPCNPASSWWCYWDGTSFQTGTDANTAIYGNDGVYFLDNSTTRSGRAVRRGGHWGLGASAGPFSADLAFAPAGTSGSIGFRCCSS